MINKYITINRAIRSIAAASREWLDGEMYEGEGALTGSVGLLTVRLVGDLEFLWPTDVPRDYLEELKDLVLKGDRDAYFSILNGCLPNIEDAIDAYFAERPLADITTSIIDLLHPAVIEAAYRSFRDGHCRDAVFNAQLAVFELLRQKTGLDKDGSELVGEALSLSAPLLVFGDLATESGQNEQKGFIQILQGSYQAIRNPKAHSLRIEVSQSDAAQHLVFASLLCRRIEEAKTVGY